ncbi:MAG: ribonuclease P protein component [Deltaproteobacteria bacterium]|nr:ribonuclease P protein component [Deltaproteobacteria bacterium]
MISPGAARQSLPKSARLLTRKDFHFRSGKRLKTDFFLFYYCQRGSGRLGVSLSKKVLRLAVARNRIRRLIREVFRKNRERFRQTDVHVVGLMRLAEVWAQWKETHVKQEFEKLFRWIEDGKTKTNFEGG